MEHPLSAFRAKHSKSVEEAAEALKISRLTIWRIENRRQDCSADLMRRINEWTGGAVTPNDLLGITSVADPPEAAA